MDWANTITNILMRYTRNISIHRTAKVPREADIGQNVRIGKKSRISSSTSIGKWTNIVGQNYIVGNVSIGKFCAIAPEVRIQANNHNMDFSAIQFRWQKELLDFEPGITEEKVKIGDNVWIGAGAIILPGTKIKSHAIIGAGSVVTKDVDKFEVVAGNPASNIRYRFDEETRNKIEQKNWTNMNKSKLKKNIEFFTEPKK